MADVSGNLQVEIANHPNQVSTFYLVLRKIAELGTSSEPLVVLLEGSDLKLTIGKHTHYLWSGDDIGIIDAYASLKSQIEVERSKGILKF